MKEFLIPRPDKPESRVCEICMIVEEYWEWDADLEGAGWEWDMVTYRTPPGYSFVCGSKCFYEACARSGWHFSGGRWVIDTRRS